MAHTITVEVKNVYGNEQVYPVCENAKLIARIAGTKTLTPATIKLAKELGYTVEVKTPELALA